MTKVNSSCNSNTFKTGPLVTNNSMCQKLDILGIQSAAAYCYVGIGHLMVLREERDQRLKNIVLSLSETLEQSS